MRALVLFQRRNQPPRCGRWGCSNHPTSRTEAVSLLVWLAMRCAGLTDEQLRQRAVPPSSLSLLGLVRHMAEVERNWFRPVLAGEPMGGIFVPGLDVEASFRDVDAASASTAPAAPDTASSRRPDGDDPLAAMRSLLARLKIRPGAG